MKRLLITVATLLGALVLTLAVFSLDVPQALGLIWNGALGSEAGISRTLVRATPLLLAGLAVLVAWRAGMYSIGAEGQYIMGGLCAATVFQALGERGFTLPLMLLGAIAGGAAYAGLAGALFIYRGVQVVISTILLNFIALSTLRWAVQNGLKEPGGFTPQTTPLPDTMMFERYKLQTDLHAGVWVALGAGLLTWWFLTRTKLGFSIKWVGANPKASEFGGIPVARMQMAAMFWSGGLCGLAGAITYMGVLRSIDQSFSENWGFLAIPVALLGALDPVGTLVSALYFGALFAGCEALSRSTSVGTSVVLVIQAVAVLAIVAVGQWRFTVRSKKAGEAKP